MKPSHATALAALCLGGLLSAGASARIVEDQMDVPVQVTDAYGKPVAQPIRVTLFRDDARGARAPLLVINHGRASEAHERAALGRARFADSARWFVQQGFVVAVPTRIGYGVSGGEDVENTGPCQAKRYPPAFAAAAQQTVAVLAAMRGRADVDADRVVVVGQSVGGMTAVAVAALAPPGVVAAVNFAGGGGGNPKTQPGRPCAPQQIERLVAGYGASARVPMLWVYAENDQYFGAAHPREWFEAFRQAGGNAEFVQFPPAGDDGHRLFVEFPAVWRPTVAAFLRRQGFEMKETLP